MKKRKPFWKILLYILAFFMVVLLAVVPFVLERIQNAVKDTASILTAEAGLSIIEKNISGTGTIADDDPVEIELPYGVEITKYLVGNNDFVTEGTPLLAVDKVGVMTAIYEYQEDMAYLEKQMSLYTDTGASNFLTTASKGRVMEIYAQEGDNISDVMLEHGALAVISLDGLLAVDATGLDAYPVGSTIYISAGNGSVAQGRIESRKEEISVITLSQEGQISGTEVEILDGSGGFLTSGTLYVHSPLKISAYSGTVEAVHVVMGQDVAAGATLFTYTGNPSAAEYGVYAARHAELEELTEKLFKMYTDGTVNAPCAGVVTGIDADAAAELLSAKSENISLDFLKNTDSNARLAFLGDEAEIVNGVGYSMARITEIHIGADRNSSSVTFALDNNCYSSEARARELYGTDNYTLTESFAFFAPWIPVGLLSESCIGMELMFVFNVVNGVRQPGCIAITSVLPSGSDISDYIGGIMDGISGMLGGMGGFPGGMMLPGMGTAGTQPSYEYYSTKTTKPMSIIQQDKMSVDITIDEMDILAIQKGQYALVTLDALPGQAFDGIITDIGVSGSNSGGNSKYIAEVSIDRAANMINGMNATANITVSTGEAVLSLPAEALYEEGTRSFVYTGYDEKKELFTDPVDVKTGRSDGINVEIISGLNEGQKVWYAYYDKPSISLNFMGQ